MHYQRLIIAGIVSISAFGSVNAQAATGYKRTKSTNVSKKAYYTNNVKGSTYKDSKSTKNFVFKANHALKNYKNTTWTRTKKTTITKHGKKYLYYYVYNSKNHATGWIYSKYLKAGQNYTATTPTSYKGSFNKSKAGNIYSITGKNSYVIFKKVAPVAAKTTYKVTQKRYVYKQGKKTLYYKVSKTNKSAAGWVWSGFLRKGAYKNTSSANKTTSSSSTVTTKPTTNTSTTNVSSSSTAVSSSSESAVSSSSSTSSVATDPAFGEMEIEGYENDLINEPLTAYTDLAKEKKVNIDGFVNATNDLNNMIADMRAKKVLKNQQNLDKVNQLLANYKTQTAAMAETLKPFPEFNTFTNTPFDSKGYLSRSARLYSTSEFYYSNFVGTAKPFDLVYYDRNNCDVIRDSETGEIGHTATHFIGGDIVPTSGYYQYKLDTFEGDVYSIESPLDGNNKYIKVKDNNEWIQTDIKNKVIVYWHLVDGQWEKEALITPQ